ncbi:MAG: tetratricopeptide repeat protein [Natronospirillum sp.]
MSKAEITLTRHPVRYVLGLAAVVTCMALVGCSSNQSESQVAEHIERGETYAQQGQYRAAMIEMRNAIQKNPDSTTGVIRLAEIMLTVGAYRQASTQLEPWQDVDDPTLQLMLAEAYIKQGRHVSAREVLNRLDHNNDDYRLSYTTLMADVDRVAGQHINAEAGYRDALALDPAHQPAIAGLSRLKLQLGSKEAVLDDIQQWIEQYGEDAELRYLQGSVYYQDNRLEEATSTLTEGLASLPSSDIFLPQRQQILSLLSRSLTEQGRATEAVVYNQILRNNTNVDLEESTEAAVEAIAAGDLDTARSALEVLIQQNPNSQRVTMLLGAISVQQGDLEKGSRLLNSSVDAEVSPVPFIRLATMAQIDQGQRSQALTTLDRALLARPSDVDLLSMHGVLALAEPGRTEDGVVSLNKALQIDNSRTRLRMALAQHYFNQGTNELGLQQLRSAFASNPGDWQVTDFYLSTLMAQNLETEANAVRDALAQAYPNQPYAGLLVAMTDYRYRNSADAIARLEVIVESTPTWEYAHLALAQMYASDGQTEPALTAYLDAAELNPDDINALQSAGRLYAHGSDQDGTVAWLTEVANDRETLGANALSLAAQIRLQQNQITSARTLLQNQATDNPFVRTTLAQVLNAEAQQAASNNAWQESRAKAAEAISLQPDNVNHALLLVRIAAAEGNVDEATSLLLDLQDRHPANIQVAAFRASMLLSTEGAEPAYQGLRQHWETYGNNDLLPDLVRLANTAAPEDALPLAETWALEQPTNALAWQTLGDQHLMMNDERQAEAAYREAIELEPTNINALNNLAWTLRERDPVAAVEFAATAAQQAPENPAILDTYGWTLHLNGQHEEAREVLERAQALAPQNQDIGHHLASVLTAL